MRIAILSALIAVTLIPAGNAGVVTHHQWASFDLAAGRQTLTFTLHEPPGTIRLYRLVVPRGAHVRAFAQLPKVTVPLKIGTRMGGCEAHGARVVCTRGEEGCPMPEAVWHFRVEKLSGPAGEGRLVFTIR